MAIKFNPFYLEGYSGSDTFCDREEESERLIGHIENGVNTTLFSLRRMGKTGLVHHVFHKLNAKSKVTCIFVDIFATQNLHDFTDQLASAIYMAFPQETIIGKRFLKLIQNLSIRLGFDSLTGTPELSFSFSQEGQAKQSIESLLRFLDEQRTTVVVAFNEFQQITEYPNENTEAMLRTIIQTLKNVRFIYSGSLNHIMLDMFNNSKRPFYSSTSPLFLDAIDRDKYMEFIVKQFITGKRQIDVEALNFVMDWTLRHTYYTQALCHKLYERSNTKIDLKEVKNACNSILNEREPIFFQYRNLLTAPQWNLLTAIGKEEKVFQPTSSVFCNKYGLGNPASSKRSLDALLQKEMIIRVSDGDKPYYRVYDCFLMRWFGR